MTIKIVSLPSTEGVPVLGGIDPLALGMLLAGETVYNGGTDLTGHNERWVFELKAA